MGTFRAAILPFVSTGDLEELRTVVAGADTKLGSTEMIKLNGHYDRGNRLEGLDDGDLPCPVPVPRLFTFPVKLYAMTYEFVQKERNVNGFPRRKKLWNERRYGVLLPSSWSTFRKCREQLLERSKVRDLPPLANHSRRTVEHTYVV